MKKILSAILIYSFVLLMAAAPQARAEGTVNVSAKRAMIVAKSSLYGFGGGLVVGLASQAFKKNTKNIFQAI